MLCQNCRKNEANVKYTQIINGNKTEMILCEECANKMGIGRMEAKMPSFSSIIGDFFNNNESLLDNFFGTRMLELPNNLDNFEEDFDQIFGNKKEGLRKEGKFNIESKLKNTGENKIKNTNKVKEISNEEKIKKLQMDLDKAVEEERYEDAVIIRDKINNLKTK